MTIKNNAKPETWKPKIAALTIFEAWWQAISFFTMVRLAKQGSRSLPRIAALSGMGMVFLRP